MERSDSGGDVYITKCLMMNVKRGISAFIAKKYVSGVNLINYYLQRMPDE